MKFAFSLAFEDPAAYCELARAADAAGWDCAVVSDHVVHPQRIDTPYPYTESGEPRWQAADPWPDPWVAIGAMAAVTRRLQFVTGVYVLPLRNPFAVAKAVSTAAVMSGHRVSLGFGVGWMREEFELLEQRFDARGRRADEMVEVMRALWRGGMVEHHGEFYDFGPLQMSPAPARPIPLLGGGLSDPALRRVGRTLDGWISDLHSTEQLRAIVAKIRGQRARFDRADAPLEIYAACTDAFGLDGYRRLEEIGVTHVLSKPWFFYTGAASSAQDRIDGLKRFADEIIEPMRGG